MICVSDDLDMFIMILFADQELHDAECWLDEWETHVMSLPSEQQKQFLSKQTAEGLRVSLRSAKELAKQLLTDGFTYVMTGKFNQDPLEVRICQ